MAWANGVVAANPTKNVIVSTHSYLAADGSISTSNGGYGSTSPRYLFDNLVKLHPNIKMVLSGHVGQAAVRTDTGVNGNKVLSFLQAFHSTTNPGAADRDQHGHGHGDVEGLRTGSTTRATRSTRRRPAGWSSADQPPRTVEARPSRW